MWNFPRFFAKKIQFVRDGNVINNHSSSDKRNIKFLGIMTAQNVLRLVEMIVQKVDEIVKYFLFFSKKWGYPEISNVSFNSKISHRNTDNFSKLGPDSSSFIKIFRCLFFFALVLGFVFPKCFHFIIQRIEIFYFWNSFDIKKQNVVEVDFFYHAYKT